MCLIFFKQMSSLKYESVPIKDDMSDDYSNAMRANDQDCVNLYRENCPVSILGILLHANSK